MRIFRYFKNHKRAVLLIFILLIGQAFTDLSLPHYTAQIVDVGIQQQGVENVSPSIMRESTFTKVCMLSSAEDEVLIRSSYTQNDDGDYVLNDPKSPERVTLDNIMAMPLVIISYSLQNADFDLDKVVQTYQMGAITKQQVLTSVEETSQQMGNLDESIIMQQAVQATIAEYKAIGLDMSRMQMDYLFGIGLVMMGLSAVGVVASILVSFIASRTSASVGMGLRSKLFGKVVSFSDAEIHSFSAASLITRGTNDIQQIQMVSFMLLRMVIYSPILAIGGIIQITSTNAAMSWIILLAVVIIFVVVMILMKVAMPKFRAMQSLIDRVNLVSREILTGLPVIRAFGRQEHEGQRFDGASAALYKTQLFTNRVMTFMFPLMMLIMNGVSVLIVWVGGYYIDAGTIQTGDMIAFITYSMVIIMSFLMLTMVSVMLPRADVAAQRVNEVIATDPSVVDTAKPLDGQLPKTGGATISFNEVTFSYSDSKENVLDKVSFTAYPGTTTAIIGSTGSGKSTIIKLIERFHDVTGGSITLDGIDIRDITQQSLRADLGYVPQKAFLFTGTVKSNVVYGNQEMDTERIDQALDIAQAKDFVEAKEEGIEEPISQGGTNVSGGQRQRLAIARAIASEARALLFDDSFSSLDYRTDAALRQALHSRLGDKTIIIVAQRVATILHADQIVVLDEGRVFDIGTHEELMRTCAPYQEIARSQLSEEELTEGGDVA